MLIDGEMGTVITEQGLKAAWSLYRLEHVVRQQDYPGSEQQQGVQDEERFIFLDWTSSKDLYGPCCPLRPIWYPMSAVPGPVEARGSCRCL